ncbi:MAG: methyltransferase domain-containing protein [Dehalococcoidia bacterium]
MPGLEALAAGELTAAGASVGATLAGFDRRDSIVMFETAELARALRCGLLEDAFRTLADLPTPHARNTPAALARALTREALDEALLDHHALAAKRRGRSYRVVVRVAGRQAFRREQVEAAFGRALAALLPHWVPARESAAAVEVWVHVVSARTIVGLRVSADELAQRRYKRAHLAASLKPTVARALALWSGPLPGDVVLDPMAGAGTVLRERAEAARAAHITGGDIDPAAVAAARTNAGRQAALALWDATRLPLRTGSIDAIITNPPYGRQHGTPGGIEPLYRGLLREAARVLRPGGRCVVLTGEPATLARVVPAALRIRARHRLLVRGLAVTAAVMVRG